MGIVVNKAKFSVISINGEQSKPIATWTFAFAHTTSVNNSHEYFLPA